MDRASQRNVYWIHIRMNQNAGVSSYIKIREKHNCMERSKEGVFPEVCACFGQHRKSMAERHKPQRYDNRSIYQENVETEWGISIQEPSSSIPTPAALVSMAPAPRILRTSRSRRRITSNGSRHRRRGRSIDVHGLLGCIQHWSWHWR